MLYISSALKRSRLLQCSWMDPGLPCNRKYFLPSGAQVCHHRLLTRFPSCQQSHWWHFGSNVVETIASREHLEHRSNPRSWGYVIFLDHLENTTWLYLCEWAWLLLPLPWHLHSPLQACKQNPWCCWWHMLDSNCQSKSSSCQNCRDPKQSVVACWLSNSQFGHWQQWQDLWGPVLGVTGSTIRYWDKVGSHLSISSFSFWWSSCCKWEQPLHQSNNQLHFSNKLKVSQRCRASFWECIGSCCWLGTVQSPPGKLLLIVCWWAGALQPTALKPSWPEQWQQECWLQMLDSEGNCTHEKYSTPGNSLRIQPAVEIDTNGNTPLATSLFSIPHQCIHDS